MTETAPLAGTTVTTYTYDAANRLTSVGGVSYTWDERGNLTSDGTFTYTYNAARRLVRAEGVMLTLVYTYNANGLRVSQSVDGEQTTFAWDWASGVPELLVTTESTNPEPTLYVVGHETLGRWDGATWAYHLPDALGSLRQTVDGAGAVADAREWTPYGVEVGAAQAGLGYTGDRLIAPQEDRHIASPGELDELIPGPSFVLDAAAIMYFSGEVSLDHTWNDYWMGALSDGLQLSIGMGGSWTTDKLPSRFSVNPKGWIGVEDIPRYEEKDIPRQWDSDSIGCGC
jgi:hypothetical protein